FGGALGVFAVENVGRSDVNGIDLLPFKRGFQIIVVISLYAIALAQFAVLFTISSDDRCQLGIFSMFKRRQHGRLRDVPQSDNGIANFLIPHVPPLWFSNRFRASIWACAHRFTF